MAVIDELARGKNSRHKLSAIDHRIQTTLEQANQIGTRIALQAQSFRIIFAELRDGAVTITDNGVSHIFLSVPDDLVLIKLLADIPNDRLGNARAFNDEYLTRARSDMSLELASTCVNWLRERSNLGAKPSDQVKTERKTYKLEMDQRTAGFNRLRFLPPCLAVLMIAGMGAGVWLIRRR
jgi:hypothetical protein